MTQIKNFIKKETVLTVAWILAIISMFVVIPDAEYIDYIDFRTLGILFCLMAVMAGLKNLGFFQMIAEKLLNTAGSERSLELILVLLCFFFGMFITNDVALITFVPLTLEVLKVSGRTDRVIPVVVMQTIAANLGSMATPIGNPQNLYLYTKSEMSLMEFMKLMLPYTLLALALIVVAVVLWSKKGETITTIATNKENREIEKATIIKEFIYIIMFFLCILVVVRIIPIEVMVVVTIVLLLVMDRKVIGQIDYSLLVTFVGFFIFVGNMGRIEQFQNFLNGILEGNEFITSALLSQVVSNVPAAILLSGFTSNWDALIVGVNVGGLGTLIASMASLISYKFVAKEYPDEKGIYFKKFTVINIIFLVIMIVACFLIA